MKRWLVMAMLAACCATPHAEYGDVILNKRAEKEGVRPVVFPHRFHRIRFRCKVCHQGLGFQMRAGANDVLMSDIIDGKFCGMCHNERIAWGPDRCDLCHSGKPNTPTQVHESTLQKLAPSAAAAAPTTAAASAPAKK